MAPFTANVPYGDARALETVAHALCKRLRNDHLILFLGPMGAGKTTLIAQLCRAWGVTEQVTSPTFALMNEYRNADQQPIYHFDFYRVEKVEELESLGLPDIFYQDSGRCLVEWPEVALPILPPALVAVQIEVQADRSRTITLLEE